MALNNASRQGLIYIGSICISLTYFVLLLDIDETLAQRTFTNTNNTPFKMIAVYRDC